MYDIKTLEYQKILSKLGTYAKTNYAKNKIMGMIPYGDFDEIQKSLFQTSEAYQAIVKLDDIPLGGLFEIKEALERSRIGCGREFLVSRSVRGFELQL